MDLKKYASPLSLHVIPIHILSVFHFCDKLFSAISIIECEQNQTTMESLIYMTFVEVLYSASSPLILRPTDRS